MPLSASSRIKYQLLRTALKWTGDPSPEGMTEVEIDRMYEMTEGDHAEELSEARSNFRYGGENSEIAGKEYSRHYESEEKAAKLDDGTWVGWTYWHGGGKHGEPESIDWISDAYLLSVTEEQKVVTVRTFVRA